MPFFVRFIFLFYLFLTILAVVAPLSYPILSFLPSFFIMWFSFICFNLGYKKKQKIIRTDPINTLAVRKIDTYLLLYVIGMLVFIPMYVNFYTGNVLLSLVMGFGSGVGTSSNYQEYQRYFAENDLGVFSISKLPYILGFGIAKLLFYYFLFSIVGYVKKLKIKTILPLVILFILFSMVGVARGTSFENFELLLLLIFSVLLRSKMLYHKDFFTRKQKLFLLFFIIAAGAAFLISKSLRSDGDVLGNLSGPTTTLQFYEKHWSMSVMPNVAIVFLNFTGYFTFPLYFVSEIFWKIWFADSSGFFSSIIPGYSPLFLTMGDYRLGLQELGVDTGYCWDPDSSFFIFYLGIPLYFFLVYKLGSLAAKTYRNCMANRDVGYCIALFLITYEMISLPVGNFLVVSSSNKIIIFVVFLLIHFNFFLKYRKR